MLASSRRRARQDRGYARQARATGRQARGNAPGVGSTSSRRGSIPRADRGQHGLALPRRALRAAPRSPGGTALSRASGGLMANAEVDVSGVAACDPGFRSSHPNRCRDRCHFPTPIARKNCSKNAFFFRTNPASPRHVSAHLPAFGSGIVGGIRQSFFEQFEVPGSDPRQALVRSGPR
jgi:hypothetical protein